LNPEFYKNSRYHSFDGELKVKTPKAYDHPISSKFVEAARELGYPINDDYNGENQEGFSKSQVTVTENGKRSSTSTAFLHPIRKVRKNLHIWTHSHVTKINFNNLKEATGVEFIRFNHLSHKFNVKATKEVILSAGAVNSPQILQLSGIGPREELKKFDIKEVMNLPVGENLQDHPVFGINFETKERTFTRLEYEEPLFVLDYFLKGQNGIAASPINSIAFLKLNESNILPDIQLQYIPGALECWMQRKMFGQREEFCEELNHGISMGVILLHEKSRGFVKLRSKNPLDSPILNLNFFDKKEDVDTMIKGIRIIEKLSKTKAFQKLGISLKKQKLNPFEENSDDYWRWNIEHFASHLYHASST